MIMKNDEIKTRRDFLISGFAAVIGGAACFSFGGLKEALAAARKADKPLLTADNLNALIPDQPNDQYFKMANQALKDPLVFLKKNFYITPIQNEGLASLNAEDWAKIKKGIQLVIKKKYNFVLTVSNQRQKNKLSGHAEFITVANKYMKWEVEVSSEGGVGSDGKYEGRVGVRVRATCD